MCQRKRTAHAHRPSISGGVRYRLICRLQLCFTWALIHRDRSSPSYIAAFPPYAFVPAIITDSLERCAPQTHIRICKYPVRIDSRNFICPCRRVVDIQYTFVLVTLSLWKRILLRIYLSLSWRKIEHPTFLLQRLYTRL